MITTKAIRKVINDNLTKALTDDKSRPRVQIMALCSILGIVSLFMSAVNFFTRNYKLMSATIAFAVFCLSILFLLYKHKIGINASQIAFVIGFTALFVFFIVTGIPQGFSILWICMLPTCGLLLFGRKYGSFVCLEMFVVILFFFYTPFGRSLLLHQYNYAFKLRFPLLYCAFYLVGLLLETVRVITNNELIKARNEYRYLSLHDTLTSAYNRYGFNEHIRSYLNKPDKPIVLFVVDIDHFKSINDKYGHLQGDRSLIEVARIITDVVGNKGLVYRWGGDEFAVLTSDTEGAQALGESICSEISKKPILLDSDKLDISVSIGGAVAERLSDTSTTKLIGLADECLYRSKNGGRNRCTVINISQAAD